MSFPAKIKEDVLVACGRRCALCHTFVGMKIELHHIKFQSEGGKDTFENCIPLCFNCHADMRSYDSKHPKGTKYTESELKRRRDALYKLVLDSPIKLAPNNNTTIADRRTFDRIMEILPWNGAIWAAKRGDFNGYFKSDVLRGLYDFMYACDDPSFEFLEPQLENCRLALKNSISNLLDQILTYTFPFETDASLLSIPYDWEYKSPDAYDRAHTNISQCSQDAASAYDTLVKLCRRNLEPHG